MSIIVYFFKKSKTFCERTKRKEVFVLPEMKHKYIDNM